VGRLRGVWKGGERVRGRGPGGCGWEEVVGRVDVCRAFQLSILCAMNGCGRLNQTIFTYCNCLQLESHESPDIGKVHVAHAIPASFSHVRGRAPARTRTCAPVHPRARMPACPHSCARACTRTSARERNPHSHVHVHVHAHVQAHKSTLAQNQDENMLRKDTTGHGRPNLNKDCWS
jgi:hypothetical protein